MKCEYISTDCKKNGKLHDLSHIGTIIKYEVLEKYMKEWLFTMKTPTLKAETFIFIDCMSATPLSLNRVSNFTGIESYAEKKLFSNTDLRVAKLFRENAKQDNHNYKIFTNDNNKEVNICVDCLKNQLDTLPNFVWKHQNLDAKLFLKQVQNGVGLNNPKFRIVLLYDPLKGEIWWDDLKPFLTAFNVDVIVTHFFSAKRVAGLSNKKKINNPTRKYLETTYGMETGQLLDSISKTPVDEKDNYLRKLMLKQAAEKTEKKCTIVPIFNYHNINLRYDICCFAKDKKARSIIKNVSYQVNSQYIGSIKNLDTSQSGIQLSLFGEDYVVKRKSDRTYSYDNFYSIAFFAQLTYHEFKGKVVSLKELNGFYDDHYMIPTNIKNQMKEILKKMYGVEIKNKSYYFLEKGELNEQN